MGRYFSDFRTLGGSAVVQVKIRNIMYQLMELRDRFWLKIVQINKRLSYKPWFVHNNLTFINKYNVADDKPSVIPV